MPYIYTDDINLLILQYLRESGFAHSSFTFAHESGIDRICIPGSEDRLKLVELIQKGIYFNEIEKLVDLIDHKRIEWPNRSNEPTSESLSAIIAEIHRKFKNDDSSSLNGVMPVANKNGGHIPNPMPISEENIYYFPTSLSPVNDFCYKPNGMVLTGHLNGVCAVWIRENSNFLNFKEKYRVDPVNNSSTNEITVVQNIPGGDTFCYGTRNGQLNVVNEKGVVNICKDLNAMVWTASAWHDPSKTDEPFVVYSSVDGSSALRSGIYLKSLRCSQNFNDCISDSSWSKSGVLALSSVDGSMSFLDPQKSLVPNVINLHKGDIYSHKWSPINEFLAVVADSNLTICTKQLNRTPFEISAHECEVSCIAWADDGDDILISADAHYELYVHSIDSYYNSWRSQFVTKYTGRVSSLDVVKNHPYVVVGVANGHVSIVNYRKLQVVKSLKFDQDIVQIKVFDAVLMGVRFASGQFACINLESILASL